MIIEAIDNILDDSPPMLIVYIDGIKSYFVCGSYRQRMYFNRPPQTACVLNGHEYKDELIVTVFKYP